MSDDPDRDRLSKLDARLTALLASREDEDRPRSRRHEQSGLAWRMVSELVAGMVVGLLIGYGLDGVLGTRPVFLITFGLLGFAAGVRTMMRTARLVGRQASPPSGGGADRTDGPAGRDKG